MEPWKEKAHKLIYNLSKSSYLQANYRCGKKLKKHVPYAIPELAMELIDCLNKEDEERAKAIFLSYDGGKAERGIITVR